MNLRIPLVALSVAVLVSVAAATTLPVLGKAPELVGNDWRNSAKKPTLAALKGKVVVVEFWALSCINCKHNLPAYNRWATQFAGSDFQIIGIHTPETDFERKPDRLDAAIKTWGIHYPVVTDNDGENWKRWKQEYWPAIYLVDKQGRIRDTWSGELNYDHAGGEAKLAKEIRELLAES